MASLIDTRFIFKLLQHYTKKSDRQIFGWLYLTPDSGGRRFKNGCRDSCWWPEHDSWFLHLYEAGEQGMVDCFVEEQPFPLDPWKEDMDRLLRQENILYRRKNGTDQNEFFPEDLCRQRTFGSLLYDTLEGVLRGQKNLDMADIRLRMADLCCEMDIDARQVQALTEQPDISRLCAFLVQSARSAAGKPLVLVPERTETASLDEIMRRADELTHRFEILGYKINEAIRAGHQDLERVYRQQLRVYEQIQAELMERLYELARQRDDCYQLCNEMRRETQNLCDADCSAIPRNSERAIVYEKASTVGIDIGNTYTSGSWFGDRWPEPAGGTQIIYRENPKRKINAIMTELEQRIGMLEQQCDVAIRWAWEKSGTPV